MTPLRYCRTLLATGALLCLFADAGAVPAQDPETVFRAAAQAARLGTVPPPPSGVRDLAWSELSPRGWDARNTLRRWAVADLEHDDAKIRTAAAGIRREWDLAPTVNPPAREHLAALQRYLSSQTGVTAIGRYGAFKYNNQDHSILMGLLAAENSADGAQHDLWAINTDDEYQESSRITATGLVKD